VRLSRNSARSAFTLIEVLMSVACGSLILAAVLTSSVALQRSFAAVEGYSVASGDQLRVLDYIAMDCRRALSASVAGGVLTLTVPPYYDSSGNVLPPTLASGVVSYGSGSVTIIYSKSGSNFNREVIVKDAGGTVTSDTTKAIATNVSTFTVTPSDLSSSVTYTVTFSPSFTNLASSAAVTGTTIYCKTFLRNAGARQ
jgi:hypothetical protein